MLLNIFIKLFCPSVNMYFKYVCFKKPILYLYYIKFNLKYIAPEKIYKPLK